MTQSDDESPAGKRALVVGGSTGIGRGIADAWAAEGMDVVVLSRSEPSDASSSNLRWEPLDLLDAAKTKERLADLAVDPLLAVCFSAVDYGAKRAPLGEVTEAEWRTQFEINLHGLWLTLSATLPALRASAPGLFVGVSSEVVHNAGPMRSGYAATKAAGAALLDSVRLEESTDEIRIVQVLPEGMVDTPGIRRRRSSDFDFSSYMTPDTFAPLAAELVRTRGAEFQGDSLVVGSGGDWRSLSSGTPVSQSRRAGS
ncbi:NAD(P)-dependent dehydrogenase, short-chain alcohol dehydrogenase family [Actinopolyspora lacussalsi subsp. righensis]|uniref:NAD(P)-dependent dehydrogenase, short-chain alcohol dehydrogenase family n=1 Tax=Actinopolyspora righensis TaxID=995060 RepID=A0A1I6YGA6_9ACTN|nr:SDR family oxidoreductase [Actinopolyspora righensis]SFT49400.1 NAD(P)-dependent dehydrogenase, short-chain alcohol dehydrogenase family [Actinopolyspora righensis]